MYPGGLPPSPEGSLGGDLEHRTVKFHWWCAVCGARKAFGVTFDEMSYGGGKSQGGELFTPVFLTGNMWTRMVL
jgi:hypothetical protein